MIEEKSIQLDVAESLESLSARPSLKPITDPDRQVS
jgi:hypothetical protein